MDETLLKLSEKIRDLRSTSEEMLKIGGHIQTVNKNLKKILANIKMLELNITDLVELEREK
ncbi:MAG: hypothetical protein NZ583_00520 [Desulfobacterota bacterium]|nr:hypothetical protein [Thermodesulfobacteriota bacterium]MDW8001197.1 hypothetical protein [Deltaproteobacteria bacterium]